jgi:hypothetical protein
MAIMEAAISSAASHPNMVQTYTYSLQPAEQGLGWVAPGAVLWCRLGAWHMVPVHRSCTIAASSGCADDDTFSCHLLLLLLPACCIPDAYDMPCGGARLPLAVPQLT